MSAARLLPTSVGPIEVLVETPPDRAAGPPVMLLHHGFGSARSMPATAADLVSGGRCVIRYSRPGCGYSPRREALKGRNYLKKEAEEVAPALLQALGVARAHLVGHSDGATIALMLAAMAPALVESVAAIAPHVLLEPEMIEGIERFDREQDGAHFRQRLARRHADPTFAYESWRDAWLSGALEGWTIEEDLSGVRAPILLIQGEGDEFGTLRHLESIKARVPGTVSELVLPGVGHFPHREARSSVSSALLAFLKDEEERSRRARPTSV